MSLVSHTSQSLAEPSGRMKALKAELQRQGLSGFIIPHADEYQNEYLPACAERLAWLTGFTGSAGTAVVLQDEAAIFVDGRYVLQVQTQVDPKLFVSHNVAEWPVHEWLASVLNKGHRLGCDSWLHSPKEMEQFRTACERAGAQLVTCESNPLRDRVALGLLVLSQATLSLKGIEMSLVGPRGPVKEILEIANIPQLIPVYSSDEEAVSLPVAV